MSSLISALQLVFLLGLILAVIGQIGRRVFASNSCWRCRFDLSGHPNVPDGPFLVVCPECGESIAEPAMLRVDKQVPRVGLRRTGLILMLAIVPVAVVFVRAGYSLDRYRVATDGSIIELAGTGDSWAIDEFRRRFETGKFSESQRRYLGRKAAEIILAMPQNRIEAGAWHSMTGTTYIWGDIYLDLVDQGVVSKENARQLLSQIVDLSIRVPPHNRVGDPFFVHVDLYAHAVDSTAILDPGYVVEFSMLSIENEDISSLLLSTPEIGLTPDDLILSRSQTFGISWTFGMSRNGFYFEDRHVGPRTLRAKIILKHVESGDKNFISQLLNESVGGRLESELEIDFIVYPPGDGEESRSAPSVAEIFSNHGNFGLRLRPPYLDLLELTVSVDYGQFLPDDSVISVFVVAYSARENRELNRERLILRPDARSNRLALLLIKHKELVMQEGGVWIELEPMPPFSRDQAWRPLVITGKLERVWVPLEAPNP